jgi:hypothetical protein
MMRLKCLLTNAYLLCEVGASWLIARAFCLAMGGDLVIINSAEEQEILWSEASSIDATDWWIGLSDRDTEHEYIWVDGATAWDGGAVGYNNWRDGSPARTPGEDCIEMDEHSDGGWNDSECSQSQPYICEREL